MSYLFYYSNSKQTLASVIIAFQCPTSDNQELIIVQRVSNAHICNTNNSFGITTF